MQHHAGPDHAFRRVRISHCTGFKDLVPVKVVSERLGHANVAFTIETYQHVLPGMQRDAAHAFEALVAPSVPPAARSRPLEPVEHPGEHSPHPVEHHPNDEGPGH